MVGPPLPGRRRAVVLVGSQAAPYSRSLRIARTLNDAGYASEIAAVAGSDVPDHEVDGAVVIRRYRPSGPYASMAPDTSTERSPGTERQRSRLVHLLLAGAAAGRRWLFWPHTVRGWWATLARELEPADLYHACGSLAIAPALAARERDRRAGRTSRVIYDAIDDVVTGNNMIGVPSPVRTAIRARERRWALAADGRITVNDALASSLARRWATADPPIVVPNWPDVPAGVPDDRPDLIRTALGLPLSTRIVMFQGRLGPNLGLDAAAEAILEVPDAVLCLVGFGRGFAASVARDADPRFAGRHRTLPAVHPDDIVAWTASADVAVIPLPPVSANQRAATPNKFWEAIAAGTPVVVGPDLPGMRGIVEAFELGVVAASLEPADLAAAIGEVLNVTPSAAAERRTRIAAIGRERFSWPIAAARYRELVASLLPERSAGGAEA